MNAPSPDRPAGGTSGVRRGASSVLTGTVVAARENWFLYLFLFLLPLQNLQTGYMPNLGGGFNFLNIGFLLALLGAWRCKGSISRWSGIQKWVIAYVVYGYISLLVGYTTVSSGTEDHFGLFKDSILAVMLVFLTQMSVTNWLALKRVVLFTLLPLPYMLRVDWSQHASVSRWHYSDALRISGTFSLLGANEYAAFCVTMTIVLAALLLAARLSSAWRAGIAAGIACMTLGVIWSYSRTAYIALMLGVVCVLLLWRGRWKMVVPLFIAALALPMLMPESVVERFDSTTIEEGKRDESTQMRFEFWQIAWDNFAAHPLIGSGYHTFHHPEINPHGMDTHNFFMRELTEKGLLGLSITLGMFLSILRACWRAMRSAAAGTIAYALALGMLGAWFALVLGNCFGDRFTYYPVIGYFWVYLGLTLKARDLALADLGGAVTARSRMPRPARRFAQPPRHAHG
ncbi:MAG TPA: O-antigen ligase family protein [Rudaea sp.]|jgi:O-antigen ligase